MTLCPHPLQSLNLQFLVPPQSQDYHESQHFESVLHTEATRIAQLEMLMKGLPELIPKVS